MRARNLDELSQRERQVLDLIRLGLTNEEIAQRLRISLDGAKYHVSQILSKLCVSTREEAAVWQPPERRSLYWKLGWVGGAGAVAIAAAIALIPAIPGDRSSIQLESDVLARDSDPRNTKPRPVASGATPVPVEPSQPPTREAFVYASQLHKRQVRKGTQIPYISHVLAVASIALEHGANENEAIAALLHDAVEDAGGPPVREEIRRRFGEEVAKIVDGCTDTDESPKPPWRARKEAYIAHLRDSSRSVALVSAADKLHNSRAILLDYRALGDQLWERFNADKLEILWYYRSVIDVFRETNNVPSAVVEDLERVVAELGRLVERHTWVTERDARLRRRRGRAG
jgi:DNA-binding CsgD family transcriptional regulator/5'-deoxynucleotidase YfbR-like HD superfamily hydrolase